MEYDFTRSPDAGDSEINYLIRTGAKRATNLSQGIKNNINIIIAAGMLVVTVLISLGEFVIVAVPLPIVCLQSILYVILFSAMFVTMQDSGKKEGKKDKDYVDARREYTAKRDTIWERSEVDAVSDFCEWYRNDELIKTRRKILLEANLKYDKWLAEYGDLDELATIALLRGRKYRQAIKRAETSANNVDMITRIHQMSKRKAHAIVTACMLRPVELSPDTILLDTDEKYHRDPIGAMTIEQALRKDTISKLVKTIFTTFFLVVPVCSFVIDPSITTLILGAIRLVSMAYTGYNGYKSGYLAYEVVGVRRLQEQINLLNVFFAWSGKNGNDEKSLDKAPT